MIDDARRINNAPHAEARPEQEQAALATVYRLAIERYEEKKGSVGRTQPESPDDDNKAA